MATTTSVEQLGVEVSDNTETRTTTLQPNDEMLAEEQDQGPSPPLRPCYLLALPTELRLAIYAFALHPTSTLSLTSTPTKRHSISPQISPSLLATNHQIHHEAAELLYTENEILLTIDAHDTCWPTIPERRLPQPVLEKLINLCIILDCTAPFRASYEDVDFTAFSALISLKKLRFVVVYDTPPPPAEGDEEEEAKGPRHCELLLEHILTRIPRETEVLCHIEPGSQQGQAVQELVDARERKNREILGSNNSRAGRGMRLTLVEIPVGVSVMRREHVAELLAMVPGEVRGTKSGGITDVFAAYRMR